MAALVYFPSSLGRTRTGRRSMPPLIEILNSFAPSGAFAQPLASFSGTVDLLSYSSG